MTDKQKVRDSACLSHSMFVDFVRSEGVFSPVSAVHGDF